MVFKTKLVKQGFWANRDYYADKEYDVQAVYRLYKGGFRTDFDINTLNDIAVKVRCFYIENKTIYAIFTKEEEDALDQEQPLVLTTLDLITRRKFSVLEMPNRERQCTRYSNAYCVTQSELEHLFEYICEKKEDRLHIDPYLGTQFIVAHYYNEFVNKTKNIQDLVKMIRNKELIYKTLKEYSTMNMDGNMVICREDALDAFEKSGLNDSQCLYLLNVLSHHSNGYKYEECIDEINKLCNKPSEELKTILNVLNEYVRLKEESLERRYLISRAQWIFYFRSEYEELMEKYGFKVKVASDFDGLSHARLFKGGIIGKDGNYVKSKWNDDIELFNEAFRVQNLKPLERKITKKEEKDLVYFQINNVCTTNLIKVFKLFDVKDTYYRLQDIDQDWKYSRLYTIVFVYDKETKILQFIDIYKYLGYKYNFGLKNAMNTGWYVYNSIDNTFKEVVGRKYCNCPLSDIADYDIHIDDIKDRIKLNIPHDTDWEL